MTVGSRQKEQGEDGTAATTVTVIMPVYNEAEHIEEAVESVLANELESVDLEVLVVDGMSTDGTRELVEALTERDGRVRLIDNKQQTVPYALNTGLARASGDVIIRVDGHAVIAPDFISAALEELEAHPECGCVGGSIESIGVNDTARAISMAMSSPFGVGNAPFRTGGEGYVNTLAFGAYRREVFEQVGVFDEELTRNQDGEFNHRLLLAGHKIWLSPRIRSRYTVRSSFGKLFRQYLQYGYWTVYVNRKHGRVVSPRKLVPAAFVLTLVVLAFASIVVPPARSILGLLLASYLLGGTAFGLMKTRKPKLLIRILAAYFIIHCAFGLGYLDGLLRFVLLGRAPDKSKAELTR